MIRRPPRSTLFPTRRSSDLFAEQREVRVQLDRRRQIDSKQPERRMFVVGVVEEPGIVGAKRGRHVRSEEHTSELQSHHDLVCRLLLEKKKKNTSTVSMSINN